MKRFNTYLIALAIATSGGALYADSGLKNSDFKTGDKLQQIGSTLADEKTTGDIRLSLAKTVNDGLNEKGFFSMLADLSKADRERIGDFKSQKMDDLDHAIAQFKADFKAKYNTDFDLKPEHFKDAMVYAGANKGSATVSISEQTFLGKSLDMKQIDTTTSHVVGKEPSITMKPMAGNEETDTSVTALGNRTRPESMGTNSNTVIRGSKTGEPAITDTTTIDKNKTSSSDLSTTLPPAGNVLTLNMLSESGGWTINIPDQITGEQLKGNLVKHIQMLDDQKSTWPSDVNTAYHQAAFHVLQALNDSSLASDR